MQKKIFIFVGTLIMIGAVVYIFGLYPVIRINGEIILHRAYDTRVSARELFEKKTRAASGENGELPPAIEEQIRKTALENIIRERVFQQYIETHTALGDMETAARAIIEQILKEADPDILPQATEELYGWSVEEFTKYVLYPQALENELARAIETGGTSFEEFTNAELSNASVKLYGVPWRWEQGRLVEK